MSKCHVDFVFNSMSDSSDLDVLDRILNRYEEKFDLLKDQMDSLKTENFTYLTIMDQQIRLLCKTKKEYEEGISSLKDKIDICNKLSKKGSEVSFFSEELKKRISIREGKVIDKEKEDYNNKLDQLQKLNHTLTSKLYANECHTKLLESSHAQVIEENLAMADELIESKKKFLEAKEVYETMSSEFCKILDDAAFSAGTVPVVLIQSFDGKPEGLSWKEFCHEMFLKCIELHKEVFELKKHIERASWAQKVQNSQFYKEVNGPTT